MIENRYNENSLIIQGHYIRRESGIRKLSGAIIVIDVVIATGGSLPNFPTARQRSQLFAAQMRDNITRYSRIVPGTQTGRYVIEVDLALRRRT